MFCFVLQSGRCEDINNHQCTNDYNSISTIIHHLRQTNTLESFETLVTLINHTNQCISYEATQAISERAQIEYVDYLLIDYQLDKARRWTIYSMLKSYPHKKTLKYLTNSLNKEFEDIGITVKFDDRNYWYIMTSIDSIVNQLYPCVIIDSNGKENRVKYPLIAPK